jgi:hypothetical protein
VTVGEEDGCSDVLGGSVDVEEAWPGVSGGSEDQWWGFPSLEVLTLDWTRVRTVGCSSCSKPCNLYQWPPPPLYMALCDGGPPTLLGWTPPIRARIKVPSGPTWWRST